ncbi:hypothetical protein LPJ72_004249 [Coemansia sp. Benny D160-2]|nr:hypothetical protein LPJ72_004249 [Coemansia sp. Benny D160-2]
MAILAALGMGSLRVSSANASTSTLPHRHHRSAATSAGADNASVSSNASNASNDDNDADTTDYFLQPRRKHHQLTPPSPKAQHTSSDSNSDSNAVSFDTPMATGIMKYNTSSSNSSTASPFTSKNSQLSKAAKAKTAPVSSPKNGSTANIAGIRRALRRAHTPEGLVLHYESRLRAFLGINEDGSEASNAACETGDDDGDWLMVEQDEAGGMFSPVGYKTFLDDDIVVLEKALNKLRDASTATRKGSSTPSKQNNNNNNTNCSSPEIVAGIKNSLVAQWAINDSFKRMIVHTMCRYYGLVSFSDTTDSGHTALHICHPRFFNEKDVVAPPSTTFHHFLFNN